MLRSHRPVILSPREQNAVRLVASSYGVDGDPEVLVEDALSAICMGEADESAYRVAGAAGVEFIGDFIWGRDRRQVMKPSQARELIVQGKQDGSFEGPIPEDDAKLIAEANALIELATDAWEQQVRGPEVEAILRMAAQFEDGNGAESSEPTDTSSPASSSEPEAPSSPEPQSEPEAEKIPPEEQVQDARNIIERAPAPFRADDLQELAKLEPWEGYNREKVSGIIDGVNAALDDYELDELYELLRNIWAYESTHRNRQTVLNGLVDVHKQIKETGAEVPEEEESPPAQAGADAPAAEPAEPESAPSDEGGEGDGEEVPAADQGPEEPDAEADQRGEAAEEVSQGPADEAPPVAQAGPERPAEPPVDDDAYQQMVLDVEQEIAAQRMHTPEPPADAAPELSWDWTKLSDQELQRLYSTFAGFAYYVDYRWARDSRIALMCKNAADELARELMVASAHGKDVKVTILEAEIEQDENVKVWRKRQRRHEIFASAHRSERESYYKLLEQLSRHESMRMDEWQRSGGKPSGILRRSGGK
jgi:hypothetical protein